MQAIPSLALPPHASSILFMRKNALGTQAITWYYITNHLVLKFFSCSPSCPLKVNIDQKLPLEGFCKVCYGELRFSWELFRHKELGINPTDTENMVAITNLQDISTTPINSLNLALKEDVLPRDTGFTAFFKAYRRNGQYGEYIHSFVTNSPPENGK